MATSAAYPLLFPPLQLTLTGKDEDFIGLDNLPRDSKGNLHLALSDGGVYENSGAFMVKWRADHQNLFPLLVSDAGAPFRLTRPQNYLWVYRRTARTLDVLSRRVADLQSWMTEMESTEKRFIEVKLYDTIVDYFPNPLTPEEQRRIAEIRTDLDDFDDIEAELLLQRGEKLAHAAWFRNAHVLNETAGKLRGLPGWELDDDYSLSDDIPFSNFRNVKPPEEIRGTKFPLLFVLASSLLFGGSTEKTGLHIDAKSTRKAVGGPQ